MHCLSLFSLYVCSSGYWKGDEVCKTIFRIYLQRTHCLECPAVCGVFQPWESVFALWIGIRNEKTSENWDVFFWGTGGKHMFSCYYSNRPKQWLVGHWVKLITNLYRVKHDRVLYWGWRNTTKTKVINQVVPNESARSDKTFLTGILYLLHLTIT